jgi:eukaryotic-like serine/threonine-protein kinase
VPESEPLSNPVFPEHPRYNIVEKLAHGDYATVFRAHDAELHRDVAIKQIHAQYLEDPHQLEVYWREAQLIANLEHPRIMTIYDLVRDRGWLILELMMGDIVQMTKGRPIDLNDLRFLLKAVALGLQFLERHGIVHGDVKPSNMLVDKNRSIKLGDFGIARRLDKGDGSVVKGTAKYMAPEVVSDQFGEVGPHSDLYSLGFSAYELMCGPHFESLFPGLNMFGRDRQIAWMMWQSAPDRRLPPINRVLENVPDDLAPIVQKLCEKDPAKRYRTAEEVLQDLNEDKTHPRKPTAQESAEADRAARQARRRRMLAVGALACSLLLSVGLAIMPSGDSGGPTGQPNVPKPQSVRGSLLLNDLPNRRIQLESSAGVVEEFPVDQDRDTIVLNHRELLTPEQLTLGDQIEVTPVLAPDGRLIARRFLVLRAEAVEVQGVLNLVGAASRTITITPDQAPENPIDIFVPSTVDVLLNGDGVSLADLRAGDRVDVKHRSEKDGRSAESLEAQRLVKVEGILEALRLPSQLTVRLPDASMLQRTADVECQVTLNGQATDEQGRAFTLADLRKDDQIVVQHDRLVRRIDARRVMTLTGTVERADPQTQQLEVRLDNQMLRRLSLAEDCMVRLTDGEPVGFAELRAGDAVTVVEDSQDGRARSIQAVLAPDRRVWAVIMAQSRHDDRRITTSPTILPSADLLRRTFLQRLRVVEEQLLWLPDATRFGVLKPLSEFLQRVPDDGVLIAYYAGHAVKTEAGEVLLAARDFDSTRPKDTGLDLAALVKTLDSVGPDPPNPAGTNKTLLLDVQYGGQDRQFRPAAEELLDLLKARQGSISRSVHVIGNTSRDQVDLRVEDGSTGAFAAAVAAAYQGNADFDRDQRVTPQELFRYLRIAISNAALRSGREQMPVFYEPRLQRFTPEQWEALRVLIPAVRRGGRMDETFMKNFHHAVVLTPEDPDATLLYALALLNDRQSSRIPLERFEEMVAKFPDHPNTIVAYHALAWLHFRSRDYDLGFQNLAQAVSRVPDANHSYSKHLFAFAAQLTAFDRYAVNEGRQDARQAPVVQSVAEQGESARSLFRDCYGEVQAEVKKRMQQIQQAASESERKGQEIQLKNINMYAKFDPAPAIDFLEESLGSSP